MDSRRIKASITILVFLVFAVYFALNINSFKPLLEVNLYLLILVAVANIGMIFSNGIFTQLIMRPFDKYISKLESFYVSLISTIGNFFAPIGAGFGFRAIYLKKKHDFPYSSYISTLAGNYLMVFMINSLLGLIALSFIDVEPSYTYWALVAVFASLFLICLILSLVKIPLLRSNSPDGNLKKFIKNLRLVTEGWNYIISNKKLLFQLAGLTLINFTLAVIIIYLVISALHYQTNFAALILFAALGVMSLFINITPANIGIKEAIYLFSATVLGFSISQILSIALIERGVLFITLLVLWLSSPRIRHNVKTAPA